MGGIAGIGPLARGSIGDPREWRAALVAALLIHVALLAIGRFLDAVRLGAGRPFDDGGSAAARQPLTEDARGVRPPAGR
jgi:hypothetical protein